MVDRSRLKKWAAVVIAVVTGVGSFVAWLAGLTVDVPQALPTWQGFARSIRGDLHAVIFYLVLFGLTAANAWLWVTGRRRREPESPPLPELATTAPLAQETEPPVSAPPAPEPLASKDSAERLLEMYKPWELALASAIEVLEREICRYAGGVTKEVELLAFAIREYPIRDVQHKMSGLRGEFKNFTPRQVSQTVFDNLKEEVQNMLPHLNFQLVFWINKAGPVIRGDELYSSRTYLQFLSFYGTALATAERNKYHSEVGELARTLMNVETKPVTPSEGSASATASGPAQQP